MDPLSNLAPLGAASTFGAPMAGGVIPPFGLASSRAARCCQVNVDPQMMAMQQQTSRLMLLLLKTLLELMAGRGRGGDGFSPLASPEAGARTGPEVGGASSPATAAGSRAEVGVNQGQLQADAKGKVAPGALQAYLEKRIATSKLNGFKPRDGARYGVDGSPRSWAAFLTKLVAQESGYDTNAVGDVGVFRGGSRGLFQLSYDDATSYGLNGGKPFTSSQLADPAFNADVAVAIMERLVLKTGSISEGGGQYWAPIKRGWTG